MDHSGKIIRRGLQPEKEFCEVPLKKVAVKIKTRCGCEMTRDFLEPLQSFIKVPLTNFEEKLVSFLEHRLFQLRQVVDPMQGRRWLEYVEVAFPPDVVTTITKENSDGRPDPSSPSA